MRHDHHRRRRRRALLVVAGLAAVIGAIVGSAADESAEGPAAEPTVCEAPGPDALTRVAGQSVMVRMEASATDSLRRRARAGDIGGVVLFPPEDIRGERLSSELERLQRAASRGGNPPLLVAIDQEGGEVERLPALAPQLSPYTLAQNDDPRDSRLEGRAAGFQLRELGIDVDLAPVLDVPASADHFMTPRAFGSTPEQVARLGYPFAAGLRQEAVAATAKHFPGLGHAAENTDFAPTAITASRRLLRADMQPFTDAIERGIDLVMVSSAAYPRLGSTEPAVLSPAVVTELLRGELAFEGVVVSDDLLAEAIAAEHSAREAAVMASRAGVDLLLFAAASPSGVAAAVENAVGAGELDEAALRASCTRVVTLKQRLAPGEPLPR